MKKLTQKEFEIKGRFTGSRLAGREHEFIYEIFYNGKRLGDYNFTSKAKARTWLGKFVKIVNEMRKANQ